MNEVQAAFGLLQLQHMDKVFADRALVDQRYRNALTGIRGIHVHKMRDGVTPNYSYFPIMVEADFPVSRDELYQRMRDAGFFGRRYFYPLISEFPTYRGLPSAKRENLPVATQVANTVLCLPIYPALEAADQDAIIRLIVETSKESKTPATNEWI